jgi:hypothetical protein
MVLPRNHYLQDPPRAVAKNNTVTDVQGNLPFKTKRSQSDAGRRIARILAAEPQISPYGWSSQFIGLPGGKKDFLRG